MARAVLSANSQNNSLTMEVVRRLRNSGELLRTGTANCLADQVMTKPLRKQILDSFNCKLKLSGYNVIRRRNIFVSGLLGYERKARRNKEMVGSRHRLGAGGIDVRLIKKVTLKSNWFKKVSTGDLNIPVSDENEGGVPNLWQPTRSQHQQVKQAQLLEPTAVLFVTRTPGGELLTRVRQRELELQKVIGRKVRSVEKAGTKLEHVLVKKDPWEDDQCRGGVDGKS